jgi:drug/metabolite transporter (DMT)-like permease
MSTDAKTAPPSLAGGRLCIALAALFWSSSGAFTKLLTQDTPLHLNEPKLTPLQIAFWRVLFAALVLLPLLRRRDLSWRPALLGMAACFAVMNALFVSAMALGTAATAILLQYTAPMWMYLASVWLLGEAADRRSSVALVIGLAGIAVIVAGGWRDAQLGVVAIALGSGLAYAGVMVYLRLLRDASSLYLTVVNFLTSALVLVALVWPLPRPAPAQLAVLFGYGAVQMALPYWLAARGLRRVSPQEAGTITLLEPLLNPAWAYLVSPKTEVPSVFTWVGGAFILGALAWRYAPRRRPHRAGPEAPAAPPTS